MSHLFTYRDAELYSHHTLDRHPDPDAFSMHAHEWFEIFYFISGRGSYLVEGNQYPLQPNDILLLRPAETHKLSIEPETPYERITIHFAPSLLTPLDPEHRLLRMILERPLGRQNHFSGDNSSYCQLRNAFADFTFDQIPDIRLNLMARVLLFLTALSGIYEEGAVHMPAQGLQSQVVAYVNEHLFEPISLQTVADRFYRSRSQIGRIFQQATGSSLWEYVTIKRLLAARAMIQRGESAGAACIACGFSDYSAFFRAYRARFQHSPREDAPK